MNYIAEKIADKYNSVSGYIAQLSLKFGNVIGQVDIDYSATDLSEIKELILKMERKFGRNVEVMTYKLWIDILENSEEINDNIYDMLKNWYYSKKAPRNIYLEYTLLKEAATRHEFKISIEVGDKLRGLTYMRLDSNEIRDYLTNDGVVEKFKGRIVDLNRKRYKGFIKMENYSEPRLYFEYENNNEYEFHAIVEFEIGFRLRGLIAVNIEILKTETMISKMKEFGTNNPRVNVTTLKYNKTDKNKIDKSAYKKKEIEPFDDPKKSTISTILKEDENDEPQDLSESKNKRTKKGEQSELDDFFNVS
jgi:hypothetical protein